MKWHMFIIITPNALYVQITHKVSWVHDYYLFLHFHDIFSFVTNYSGSHEFQKTYDSQNIVDRLNGTEKLNWWLVTKFHIMTYKQYSCNNPYFLL